jgi:hypothetical protein
MTKKERLPQWLIDDSREYLKKEFGDGGTHADSFALTRQVPADIQETRIETDAYLRGYQDAMKWIAESLAALQDDVAYEHGKAREARS